MRTARQLVWLFLPLLCGVGCFQCSLSAGTMDGLVTPWEYRTQYAFWNEHYYEAGGGGAGYQDNAARKRVDRTDLEDGNALFIMLFGFVFDYQRDFNTFTGEERSHFANGMKTQPLLWVSVSHAEDLAAGDEIKFDSEDTTPVDRAKPRVSFYHSPGTGVVYPWTGLPDEIGRWGSHIKGTLTLRVAVQPPLPGPLVGTIEYSISKGANDPDDVMTGEFTTNFTADVIGERIGLCNYYAYFLAQYPYYYAFYLPDGCASFSTNNGSGGSTP
jgi:hypothetical protein